MSWELRGHYTLKFSKLIWIQLHQLHFVSLAITTKHYFKNPCFQDLKYVTDIFDVLFSFVVVLFFPFCTILNHIPFVSSAQFHAVSFFLHIWTSEFLTSCKNITKSLKRLLSHFTIIFERVGKNDTISRICLSFFLFLLI